MSRRFKFDSGMYDSRLEGSKYKARRLEGSRLEIQGSKARGSKYKARRLEARGLEEARNTRLEGSRLEARNTRLEGSRLEGSAYRILSVEWFASHPLHFLSDASPPPGSKYYKR